MDRFLRQATLVVLLLLALAVWFETSLFGGERGVLRLVVGVLCVYVAVQSLERQRLQDTFKQVLHAFRGLHQPGGAAAAGAAPSARDRRQAAEILIAALRRGGATAELALGNLKRVTGQDHGHDADAWQRWLDGQPRD